MQPQISLDPRPMPPPPLTAARKLSAQPSSSAAKPARASLQMLPHSAQSSDRQWQQVLARDPAADGLFVYAVSSTNIYCRPTCPSRRATRHNVSFFPNPAAAERAGFRACKRCRPDSQTPDPHAALVAQAARILSRANGGEPVRLADLARTVETSRLTLLRAFRRVLGVTPSEFARAQRVTHFKDSLRPDSLSPASLRPVSQKPGALKPTAASRRAPAPPRITDAIYRAGFGSSSRLYESSTSALGMTPRTLRTGGAGAAIRYTTARSPLGRILVAATDLGVCAIAFGRDDAELLADLRARFPRAELSAAKSITKSAAGWLANAVAFVLSQTTEHPLAADFPLDVRATAFQHRVWKALQQIPRGQTRSYAQIARAIGRPTAMRAVGAAIGANPVAVVVPCHRVIGSDGSLTGYHWGLDRKRKLLAAEGVEPPSS